MFLSAFAVATVATAPVVINPSRVAPARAAVAAAIASGDQDAFTQATSPLLSGPVASDDEARLLIEVAAHAVKIGLHHRMWVCEQAVLRIAAYRVS